MSEEEDANNESSSADAKLKEENHIVQYLTDNKNVLKVIYRKTRFDHFLFHSLKLCCRSFSPRTH